MQACEQKVEEVARRVKARDAGNHVPQEAQRMSRSSPVRFCRIASGVCCPALMPRASRMVPSTRRARLMYGRSRK
jgi:hypothetical protein